MSAERGLFFSAAVSHPLRLSAHVEASIEAALGFNHAMWVEDSGFSDVRTTAMLTFERPAQRLAVTVAVDYIHGFLAETVSNKVVASVGLVSR